MAANNMVNPSVDPKTEDELFAKEVEEVKRWWSDSRWRNTKRPFTAEQIVSKRGNLKIEYPSNAQSKKLWDILEARFKVGPWGSVSEEANRPRSEAREAHEMGRTEMPATLTAAWNPQWSRRWPNTWILSTYPDGSRPRQHRPRMSLALTWLITPT